MMDTDFEKYGFPPLTQQMKTAKKVFSSSKLFIFDMDGTIYLGNSPFPFAVSFIRRLRENGHRVLFFTNNASKDPKTYVEKLSRLGFEPRDNELLTSGDVTVAFLKSKRPGKSVYLVGTPELERQFTEAGIVLSENSEIVVTSFDTTLTYEKLNIACRLIRGGAEFLSTHPDFNCPTEDGFIPDSGAITAFITASTGITPRYFGKPYPDALEMIREMTGVRIADMCIFGDRLYTDIAFGRHNGAHSALVLTGESDLEMTAALNDSDRPEIILPSLAETEKAFFD